jgi:hypothetical protein
MSIELTNEEKTSIVNDKIKGLLVTKYDLELGVQQQRSVAMPDQTIIDSLTLKVADLESQLKVLNDELTSLKPAE